MTFLHENGSIDITVRNRKIVVSSSLSIKLITVHSSCNGYTHQAARVLFWLITIVRKINEHMRMKWARIGYCCCCIAVWTMNISSSQQVKRLCTCNRNCWVKKTKKIRFISADVEDVCAYMYISTEYSLSPWNGKFLFTV